MPLTIMPAKKDKKDTSTEGVKSSSPSKKTQKRKKTEPKKTKDNGAQEPITVTAYGKSVRKIYKDGKWYFAVEDIIAMATVPEPGKKIKYKDGFEGTKKKVTKNIGNVAYADSTGNIKLLREMEASFPGPIHSWLATSAEIEYFPPQPTKRTSVGSKDVAPGVGNPSDSR